MTWFSTWFLPISGFLNGVTAIIFGLLVFLAGPRKKINRLLSLVCLAIAGFGITYGASLTLQVIGYESNFLLARLINFFISFIPLLSCHWVLAFLGVDNKKINKVILSIGYSVTFLFVFTILFTNYFIVRTRGPGPGFFLWSKAGPLLIIFILVSFGGLVGYLIFNLFKHFRITSGYKREQIKYILITAFLGFLGGATNYFYFFDIPIFPFGNPLIALFPIFFGYSIIKHRLMDIRWVLGRVGIYVMSFLVVITYAIPMFYLNQELILISPFVFNIFVVTTVVPLFLYSFYLLEKVAGKYFYYTLLNLKQTVKDLGKQLNQTISSDKLTNLINHSILEALKLERIGIVLKKPEGDFFVPSSVGFAKYDLISFIKEDEKCLVDYFKQLKQPLIKEEILRLVEKIKKDDTLSFKDDLIMVEKKMDQLKIAVLLPLFVEEKLIGLIILGNKESQNAFTVQDIECLTLLSPQASVALNNALSYEEINQRKANLEEFYKLAIGRELRMVELKKKIKEMKRE